ncbi:MarR family transcriptional regulator [Rhodopseudomonas sp. AAP120]|uniref:MarR family winged helix-turn-helix transcriptional regulator n=1 Tax=Rhodopseudomonas sp. AAP120 TaxID=1523430 RepID=UPI0006B8C335|nr:MarR family transcriptional regulator [Rhodopseudomonas sp. AAP120]KPF99874.1 MarR family transcriptional regulator [Rhodopseudomonas sp. AAP120]
MKSNPTSSIRLPRGGDKQKLQSQLCFALYSTLLGVNKVYRSLLREFDLTYPQYLVLLVLWERDRVNVSEICDQLYLETTTLTPLLKRLEARGLISRRRSAEDERQVIVSLTDEGRALRQQLKHVPDCLGAAMGGSLEEIVELRNKLTKVRDHLFEAA